MRRTLSTRKARRRINSTVALCATTKPAHVVNASSTMSEQNVDSGKSVNETLA
jgi:hypothetical protein